MNRIILAAAAIALTAGCVQAQSGPTTTFDGLAGSRDVDTDGNVEMNGAAVSLSGRVGGWVEMNGGAVEVDARIGGDLEVNGGAVEVSGSVGGETLINGGAVELNGSFAGLVMINAGAAELTGDFAEGFTANAGGLEFSGEARGDVVIKGSGRERNWRGQPRGDRSQVEINGRLPAGASICAHEVRFGADASFVGAITVLADSEPEFADGVDQGQVSYSPRAGESCD
jgi:hypothetical protein